MFALSVLFTKEFYELIQKYLASNCEQLREAGKKFFFFWPGHLAQGPHFLGGFFVEIFLELERKFFFLSGQALTPPPLSGRVTKKKNLICFAASLSNDTCKRIGCGAGSLSTVFSLYLSLCVFLFVSACVSEFVCLFL